MDASASGTRDAWTSRAAAADRIGDRLLLLEHPAVLTLGRGADETHVLAPPALLEARGIELLRVECWRRGDLPGQLVAYPIIKLADGAAAPAARARARGRSRRHVRGLRGGWRTAGRVTPGCGISTWMTPGYSKIGALGIRIQRGTSYHGIALNVDVDLADFGLIDRAECPASTRRPSPARGGRPGERPSTAARAAVFARAFSDPLCAPALPPDACTCCGDGPGVYRRCPDEADAAREPAAASPQPTDPTAPPRSVLLPNHRPRRSPWFALPRAAPR